MKVLFLDVDGVMNNNDEVDKVPPTAETYWHSVQKGNVGELKHIIEQTGCVIVTSSSCRGTWNKLHLSMLLNAHFPEFEFTIIGDTPHMDKTPRGYEILAWIRIMRLGYISYRDELTFTKEKLESFVVLDDDNDMDGVSANFVKIDENKGLTRADAEKAIAILNGTQ